MREKNRNSLTRDQFSSKYHINLTKATITSKVDHEKNRGSINIQWYYIKLR